MKKILPLSLVAIIAIAVLVTSFSIVQARIAKGEKFSKQNIHFGEKMDKAVWHDKITEDQKEAIIARKEELKERYEALRDLPKEESMEEMRKMKEEMKEWAEENGINLELFGYHKFGRKHKYGK